MANDDLPNLDDLKLPDDGLLSESLQDMPPAEAPAEPIEARVEEPKATEEPAAEESEAEASSSKLPVYIEYAAAIGVPVVLLGLAVIGLIYFATAFYLIAVGFVPYGIWKGRDTNTIFTIVLGCTLIAILTAIYCLWLEVGRYKYDVGAKDVRRVSRAMDRP